MCYCHITGDGLISFQIKKSSDGSVATTVDVNATTIDYAISKRHHLSDKLNPLSKLHHLRQFRSHFLPSNLAKMMIVF